MATTSEEDLIPTKGEEIPRDDKKEDAIDQQGRKPRDFHTRHSLPNMTCKDWIFGCGPLICLAIIAIFAVIVYSIAESEITDSPTPAPTLSPTTFAPSLAPTLSAFNQRRETFIDAVVASNVVLQAYRGQSLTASLLNNAIASVAPTKKNADYGWDNVVRILYYTQDEDVIQQIYDAANASQPFWVHSGDIIQYYWTENHMIQWDAAAHLLKQKFEHLEFDSNVDERLKTYLQMKKDYNYFEFHSNTYTPYRLSALLNLVDFSQNPTIQSLAVDAVEVMLFGIVENLNSEGGFFPAQGRSLKQKFTENAADENAAKCWRLLTGLGPSVTSSSPGNIFIAMTSMDLSSVIDSYTSSIENKTTNIGIPLALFDTLNDNLNKWDIIAFKMSAGLFWDPAVYEGTIAFANNFSLQAHPEFAPFLALFTDPEAATGQSVTHEMLIPLSESSVLNEITNVLYKNGPAMLSSFQEYLYQYLGYQQYPCVASTGTIAVFANSGTGSAAHIENVHMPFVKQNANVAVLKYDSTLLRLGHSGLYAEIMDGFSVTDIANVYWYFPQYRFNEVRNNSNWILGKEIGNSTEEGYVAFRRDDNCVTDAVDDIITCGSDTQVYGLFVGSSNDYNSFDEFETVVQAATFDANTNTLSVDGKTVSVGGFL